MGCIPDFVEVFTNEDRVIPLRVTSDGFTPFPITGATEIVVYLPKADGTKMQKKLSLAQVTIINGPAGDFSFILPKVDAALLKVKERQDVIAVITIAGKDRTCRWKSILTVTSAP